jgi:hypothetical protein
MRFWPPAPSERPPNSNPLSDCGVAVALEALVKGKYDYFDPAKIPQQLREARNLGCILVVGILLVVAFFVIGHMLSK